MYKDDEGVWRDSTHTKNGKTLADAVHLTLAEAIHVGHGWELLARHMMKWQRAEYSAIMAEIAQQKGPETVVAVCPACGYTTRHTLDGVCVKCNKEAGK